MAGRAVRVTSRILFGVCGLTTLLTAVPYAMLRGVGLPVQSEWVVFVVVLGVVGVWSVVVALLPRSWMAKLSRREAEDQRMFSTPLKLLAGFAAAGYLVGAVAHFAPTTWDLNPQLMFVLCPMYFLKMTFDPAPGQIFLLLAPMNAAVYGSVGLTLEYAWQALRR